MELEGKQSAARVNAAVDGGGARQRRNAVLAGLGAVALVAVCVGALFAATRGLVWPRGINDAMLAGAGRAALLFALGASLAFVFGLIRLVRRTHPEALDVARDIDAHLELDDVVSSAWALQDETTEAAQIAVQRGASEVEGLVLADVFPRPSMRPRARRVLAGVGALALGIAIGAMDPSVLGALLSPPTATERAATDDLERAAQAMETTSREEREGEGGQPEPRRAEQRLAAQVRQVTQAARRGERERAMNALRRITAGRQRRVASAQANERRLRSIAQALGRSAQTRRPGESQDGQSRAAGSRSAEERSASQRARQMARLLRRQQQAAQRGEQRDAAAERRMLERLERAAQRAAERQAEADEQAEQIAQQLAAAAEAMNRGEMGEASEAMQALARALERMERQTGRMRAQEARQASVFRRMQALERALQLGRMGREGDGEGEPGEGMARGEGQGEGEGRGQGEGQGQGRQLSAAIANRLAALGLARGPSSASDTHGPGESLNRRGRSLEGLDAERDSHARSAVTGEGERAVAAVSGLGANGEPTTEYEDVFPSYGVRVEEALTDERIPASRRRTVRRYFESIRPDGAREQ